MNTEMNTSDNTAMTTDPIRLEEGTMTAIVETAIEETIEVTETAIVETTEETMPEPTEPIVALPDGKLACRFCGIATSPRPPLFWVVVEELGGSVTPQRRRPVARHEIPLTTCADCAEITERTAALLEAHPGLYAARGAAMAEPLALGVVVAHRLLGLPLPEATITDAEFARLVRTYDHGTAATWERAVYARPNDLGRVAASAPWSAVGAELQAGLRAARAALLAERLAETRPPHHLAPPALTRSHLDRGPAHPARVPVDGGCAWCGVSTITLPAVEVHRLGGPTEATLARWRPILRDRFAGHLCPACADALDTEGAYGQTAVEAALIAHLELGRRHLYLAGDITIDGVEPWAALHLRALSAGRPAPAPSPSPWAHVGDLAGLRSQIAAVLGVAR